jgi:hypothetical protein
MLTTPLTLIQYGFVKLYLAASKKFYCKVLIMTVNKNAHYNVFML